MKAYDATATIQADPTRVMGVLTDAPRYPEWNSTVERVDGQIAQGETITVHAKISPGRAFPVKVAELIPGQKMVWSGGMPLGLFKGVRTFKLTAGANGTTVFTMREEFSGLLLPLIWNSMPDLGPSFQQFTLDLKKCAEAVVTKTK
jgi:hypothetical protein